APEANWAGKHRAPCRFQRLAILPAFLLLASARGRKAGRHPAANVLHTAPSLPACGREVFQDTLHLTTSLVCGRSVVNRSHGEERERSVEGVACATSRGAFWGEDAPGEACTVRLGGAPPSGMTVSRWAVRRLRSMSLFQQPPNTLVLFVCDLPIGEPSLECLHRAVGAAARAACRAYRPDEQRDQSAPEEHGEAEPEHAPGPADSPGPAGSPE